MKQKHTFPKADSALSHGVTRRGFLTTLALLAVGNSLPACSAGKSDKTTLPECPDLRFRKDGKFKIVQLTDTHVIAGDERSSRALQNVAEMLDVEKPDLVIHTGDIIFGRPARDSFQQILSLIGERRIPWAVALGNHDGQFGLSRQEAYDFIRTLPYNINTQQKVGVSGDSNDIITLSTRRGRPERMLCLFDSHDEVKYEGKTSYASLEMDQVDWFEQQACRLARQNKGKALPTLIFQHIPPAEFTEALADKDHHRMTGNQKEKVCSPSFNNGTFTRIMSHPEVEAIFCGHDHDNDYAMHWHGCHFVYGRYSGCDTVYNNLKPNGCRVIELEQGKPGFRTYIRLFGGNTEQEVVVPGGFKI